jgi:hypothetical protein
MILTDFLLIILILEGFLGALIKLYQLRKEGKI